MTARTEAVGSPGAAGAEVVERGRPASSRVVPRRAVLLDELTAVVGGARHEARFIVDEALAVGPGATRPGRRAGRRGRGGAGAGGPPGDRGAAAVRVRPLALPQPRPPCRSPCPDPTARDRAGGRGGPRRSPAPARVPARGRPGGRRRRDGERCHCAGVGDGARCRRGRPDLGHRHQRGRARRGGRSTWRRRAPPVHRRLPRVELVEGSWLDPLPEAVARPRRPGGVEPAVRGGGGVGRVGSRGEGGAAAGAGRSRPVGTEPPDWPTWKPCSSRPAGGSAGPEPSSSSWRRNRAVRHGNGRGNSGTTRCGSNRIWRAATVRWWHGSVAHNREMDVARSRTTRPILRWSGRGRRRWWRRWPPAPSWPCRAWAATAWPCGRGLPRARRAWSSWRPIPTGRTTRSGRIEDVRTLTSGWTDEMQTLLERCWPGPVEVFVPRAGPADGSGPEVGGQRVHDVRAANDSDDGAPQPRRLGGRGGHARRTGIAAAVPRAGSVADGAAPLHRGGGSGPGFSSRGRGGRGRRRLSPGPRLPRSSTRRRSPYASCARACCPPPSFRGR